MIAVRPARKNDLEAMSRLLALLFAVEVDFTADAERQRRGLALLLDSPRVCLLVAEEERGRVVGMCSGQVVISTAEGGPALLVEDVVVDEPWRGQGIGGLLMEELTAWARQRRIARLQLLADRHNQPALAFYRRLGWLNTELICLRRYSGQT